MNFLKTIGILLLILVLVFCTIGLIQPKTYAVERKIEIKVPSQEVYDYLCSWKQWKKWSPWEKLDSSMYSKIEGKDGQLGSRYNWNSRNTEIGSGYLKFTKFDKNEVSFDFNMMSPLNIKHKSSFNLMKVIERTTKVTWVIKGELAFFERVSSIFWSMDDIIGQDMEKGLRNLKNLVEKEHAKNNQIGVDDIEKYLFNERTYLVKELSQNVPLSMVYRQNFPIVDIRNLMSTARDLALQTTGSPVVIFNNIDTNTLVYSMLVALPLDSLGMDTSIQTITIRESKAAKLDVMDREERFLEAHLLLQSFVKNDKQTAVPTIIIRYNSNNSLPINSSDSDVSIIYLYE